MPIPYERKLIPYAKKLRKEATPQEDKLWYRFLKDYPIWFQRQKPLILSLQIFIVIKQN